MQDTVNLEFTTSVCTKCDKNVVREGVKGVPVACSIHGQLERIPLTKSTCYPLIVSTYSRLTRFFGGIVTFVQFQLIKFRNYFLFKTQYSFGGVLLQNVAIVSAHV